MLNALRKQPQYPPHLSLDRDIDIDIPWHQEVDTHHAPAAASHRQPLTTLSALEIIRKRYERDISHDHSVEAA